MGFNLKNDAEAYSFKNFVKEMFFDSETNMVVISGVPGRENQRDARRQGARRHARRAGGILPSWLMSQSKKSINELAGSTARAVPGQPGAESLLEQDHQLHGQGGDRSSRWSARSSSTASIRGSGTATPIPGQSGGGFQLDDDNAQWFIRRVAQARAED